ncbi:MAG: hypothetical protein ACRD1A_06615 [Terriglobales bacterium]
MSQQDPRRPEREFDHPDAERRSGPRPVPHAIRLGKADVEPQRPSHTPGTSRGEELIKKSPEKGRRGLARTARSATSINASLRGPIDPRMPHLPPA